MTSRAGRLAREGGKLLGLGVASVLVVMVGGAVLIGGCFGVALLVHTYLSHGTSVPRLTFLLIFVCCFLLFALSKGRRLDRRATRIGASRNASRAASATSRSAVEDTPEYLADLRPETPPGG